MRIKNMSKGGNFQASLGKKEGKKVSKKKNNIQYLAFFQSR